MVKKQKTNHGQFVKALAKLNGREVLSQVKMPRKRRKETSPRKKYNRVEDKIRNEIIRELRKKNVAVKRIENAICGRHNTGIPDLWVFNYNKRLAGWMEVKGPKGLLSDEQKEFQNLCAICGIHFWVVKSVTDAMEVIL